MLLLGFLSKNVSCNPSVIMAEGDGRERRDVPIVQEYDGSSVNNRFGMEIYVGDNGAARETANDPVEHSPTITQHTPMSDFPEKFGDKMVEEPDEGGRRGKAVATEDSTVSSKERVCSDR